MSDSPVKILDNFLSHEQCQELINCYKDKVARSTIVDSSTQAHKPDSSRTSSTYYIPDSDQIIRGLKEKVADFLKININQIEGIQFLRYLYGEKYSYHHDYLPGNPSNQRVHTIIVYLNDLLDGAGGETSFFHYKLKVKPKEGTGVWFRNMDNNGNLVKESLHSGEPILQKNAIKYALNIWTRQNKIY
jgi:prolyl 4-hydroxylase